MHPEDMASRAIEDGTPVTVRSRAGEVTLNVEASQDIMPGVVSLPHGYGHNRKDVRVGIAVANAGVSCNDVTDEQYVDQLSGNAVLNGVPVEVMAR
jgi:anaerobic selenocysteine-containing dehydrogenase